MLGAISQVLGAYCTTPSSCNAVISASSYPNSRSTGGKDFAEFVSGLPPDLVGL